MDRRRLVLSAVTTVGVAALAGAGYAAASGSGTARHPLTVQAAAPTTAPTVATTALPTSTTTATTTTTTPTTTAPPTTVAPTTSTTSPCPFYPASTYGTDPNTGVPTGGGTQLLTVVAPSSSSRSATLVVWTLVGGRCWEPVQLSGQPSPPWTAETGYGGLKPLAERVSGDGSTPTGLYGFGPVIYGNSTAVPSNLYPYHHLVCGDWWDEQPGSPTYEQFEHVNCGDTPSYASDSEALWTETEPYQHFIDIPMPNPPDNAAGIFLHDDTTSGDTAGCVALPNAELDAVLGWLNPADNPHILIEVAS